MCRFPRGMPECECNHGCTMCIGKITQRMNIIIYLVSHQWEQWKRAYLRRSPRKGERMLLRYHDLFRAMNDRPKHSPGIISQAELGKQHVGQRIRDTSFARETP